MYILIALSCQYGDASELYRNGFQNIDSALPCTSSDNIFLLIQIDFI
jgi:hypothetical protein